jgi:hypothetical protein
MKNEKVIENFITQFSQNCTSHTKNLYTCNDNSELVNYRTTLAKFDHENRKLYVNITKYSVTTSKIQTYLKRELKYVQTGYEIVYVNHKDLN